MNEKTNLAIEFFYNIECEKESRELGYGIEENIFKIENEQKSFKLKKPIGEYYCINCDDLNLLTNDMIKIICDSLALFIKKNLLKKVKIKKVLVVGLGNEKCLFDCLGTKVINNIMINSFTKTSKIKNVYTFCPSVKSNTGVEECELIKTMINKLNIDAVVLVDSLFSLSASRLGSTFQISSNGEIEENGNETLNTEHLGVPTILIGCPLVIKTKTIIDNVIEKISNNTINLEIDCLKNSDSVVTLKNIEEVVEVASKIMSQAINMALYDFTFDELKIFN